MLPIRGIVTVTVICGLITFSLAFDVSNGPSDELYGKFCAARINQTLLNQAGPPTGVEDLVNEWILIVLCNNNRDSFFVSHSAREADAPATRGSRIMNSSFVVLSK